MRQLYPRVLLPVCAVEAKSDHSARCFLKKLRCATLFFRFYDISGFDIMQESPSCVAMAYVERSDKNTEKFEEVDAFDCAGSWYQAFIISKDDRHVLVHFSGQVFLSSYVCLLLIFTQQPRLATTLPGVYLIKRHGHAYSPAFSRHASRPSRGAVE